MSSDIRQAERSPKRWRSNIQTGSPALFCLPPGPRPTLIFVGCLLCARSCFSASARASMYKHPHCFCTRAGGLPATTSACVKMRPRTSRHLLRSRSSRLGLTPCSRSIAQVSWRESSPPLVIGAEDDIVTPAYFSEELARLIPGAEVKIFPRGGHYFNQVRAREFNNAVLPFLVSHTPA